MWSAILLEENGIATELADLRGPERLFDLYCGSGTIGLVLSARVAQVYGVDLVEESVADAITNAGAAAERHRQRALLRGRRAPRPARAGRAGGPPRRRRRRSAARGPEQEGRPPVIDAAPRKIVYVSCNPTTLAPNAAQLAEARYALRRVRPVDMFPQTPHIECVAVLER